MTAQHPLPGLAAPPVPDGMTMADLIRHIAGDPALPIVRRRNVASAIRRLCALLGLDPGQVPAAFWAFRERLAAFEPVAAGVTVRRFQTIKSDVGFALKRVSAPVVRPRQKLSGAWEDLKGTVDSPWQTLKIGRLAQYCSARGIAPVEVDDAVIEGYRSFVEQQTFKTSPQRHVRALCGQWNKLAAADRTSPSPLGLMAVTPPAGRTTYAAAWDDLPAGFRADAERWLHSLSCDADLFDADAPTRPLRAVSVDTYRFKLRQMAGALREQGEDIAGLRSLGDLVELDRVRAIVAFFQERGARAGTAPTGKITDGGILHVLRLVARYTRPDDDALHTRLKMAHGRTSTGPRSMGRRPAAALRQFDDPTAFDRLIALPPAVTARLDAKDRLTRREALDYQASVALELLIMRPIRLRNLVALRIGEHVRRDAGGVRIVIPAGEVKNDVALEHLLPAESAALLERYLDKALPVLATDRTGLLFPGALAGRPKAQENLGKQMSRLVRRHTGLAVSPHLMRHIAAKLYMHAVPEGLETMRQVLAHKSADTTARSYVGLQNAAAIARYDALVLARRGPSAPAVPR